MTPLDFRLENWGDCWRSRLRLDQAASIEGGYRSPQRRHWDTDAWVGIAPVSLPPLDHVDAAEVELAVCAIDLFHHALLKAWYIRRTGVMGSLINARIAAGWELLLQKREQAEREFAARILLAKALVDQQLRQPAVLRKARASAIVRQVLRLEPLTPLPLVPTMLPTI